MNNEKIFDRHRGRLDEEQAQRERQAIADQLRKRKLQGWMKSGEPLPIDEVAKRARMSPEEVEAEIIKSRVERMKVGEVLDGDTLKIRKKDEEREVRS